MTLAGNLTYDRQSLMFGDQGQAILVGQKVGVIGAGGAGSLIVEYLARLGVGHLVVIDPERIDRTNLPRVVGSRVRDAHVWLTDPRRPVFVRALGKRLATPKVRIARRVARQANPNIRIEALQADVTMDDVAMKLIDCDYLFLAADSMQARLVFNALAEHEAYYQELDGVALSAYPGVAETLAALRARGLPVAVFTGASTRAARILLRAADLDADIVIGGDQVDRPKPAADGMLLAAQRLVTAPGQLLLIGDSPLDLQAAKAAGSYNASAAWGHMDDPSEPADVTLSTPQELLHLFRMVRSLRR